MTGFTPRFLRAVVAEIARCERKIDKLDERIERAKSQAVKDRLSAERATWVSYANWMRQNLLR